jgi:hypothetical protein
MPSLTDVLNVLQNGSITKALVHSKTRLTRHPLDTQPST